VKLTLIKDQGVEDTSIILCNTCDRASFSYVGVPNFIHPVISTIFNDITRSIGHPGLALQAFVTILSGVIFYDMSSLFTAGAPAFILE
jgi:hypothetical protein